jgi:hypothetical protein
VYVMVKAKPERQGVSRSLWLRLLVLTAALCFASFQCGCVGTATAIGLNVATAALDFREVAVNSSSTLDAILTNTQSKSITISNVTVSGSGFSTSGIPVGSIIEPGQSTTFSVVFAPAVAGNVTGTVTLSSDAANGPVKISLRGLATHSTTLSWAASASEVKGYFVYRGTASGGPYAKLNLGLVLGTRVIDTSVLPGQAYYYVVSALGLDNQESAFSNEATVFIPTQ